MQLGLDLGAPFFHHSPTFSATGCLFVCSSQGFFRKGGNTPASASMDARSQMMLMRTIEENRRIFIFLVPWVHQLSRTD